MNRIAVFALLLLSFVSCTRRSANTEAREGNLYAAGFTLTDSADCRIATVYSPWEKGKVMAIYRLTRGKAQKGEIHVPLSRINIASSTHAGFIDAIGCTRCISGVCNPEYIYTSLDSCLGTIDDCLNLGDGMSPSVERVLLSRPDAMMISTYAQGDAAAKQLLKLNIPIIYNNEWMEHHPLARAEWIRFVAAFFCKEEFADSLFSATVERYKSLCRLAAESQKNGQKTIMSGQDFRGTWYVPSGSTYMGHLFRDACAAYHYADDPHEGSIPLTVEQAVQDFATEADVWVGASAATMEELKNADEKHTWFKAYQNGEVYNFHRRTTPSGANDFWEKGVVCPDLILADLISILYHEVLPDHQLIYTEKLKD